MSPQIGWEQIGQFRKPFGLQDQDVLAFYRFCYITEHLLIIVVNKKYVLWNVSVCPIHGAII